MKKTCYFCERFWLCMEVYNTNPSSKHCVHPDPYAQFIPNDEWKEIERLLEIEKLYGEEYEEYKKEEAKSPEQKQKEAKELHDLFYGKPTLPSFRKNRTIRINGVKYKIKDLSKLKSL